MRTTEQFIAYFQSQGISLDRANVLLSMSYADVYDRYTLGLVTEHEFQAFLSAWNKDQSKLCYAGGNLKDLI